MNNSIIYHRNFKDGQVQPNLYPIPNSAPGYSRENPLEKRTGGHSIGVTPGAIIGAITGGLAAKGNAEKLIKEQAAIMSRDMMNNVRVAGSYYDQVKNVIDTLTVMFTPVSVIYTVQNKGDTFTLDTIEVSEMNDYMRIAFKQRDEQYFKDIFVSKMHSEMQIAEQEFARRLLKKQMAVKNMVTKEASETDDVDTMLFTDVITKLSGMCNVFYGDDSLSKIASVIVDDVTNDIDCIKIALELERPFDKYAGVITGIKGSLGVSTKKDKLQDLKEKLSDTGYVVKHINVGFFPDRVIFSLGNQLVSTLPLTSMNDDGYQKFLLQDTKYFKNVFSDTVKESMAIRPSIQMTKTASETLPEKGSAQDCLKTSSVHPVLLYLVLCDRFGLEWLQYDIAAINDIVRTEFDIDDLPEANKNKIMTIMMANQSNTPFENAYAFEKAVLSVCSKPIDFMKKEREFINIQDIVFAIDVLDRVTPYDDIYDNFSLEVFNYIADVLSDKELYIYSPTNIIMSELEPVFAERLNDVLIKSIKKKMSAFSHSPLIDEEIHAKCDLIADNSYLALKNVRRIVEEKGITIGERMDVINRVVFSMGVPESISEIVKNQIIRNMALDDMLFVFEEQLQMQIKLYGIVREDSIDGGDIIE